MAVLNKTIYLLTLRKQGVCDTQKYVEFYEDKYNIVKIELNNEEELVNKALELLNKGTPIIIDAEISYKNIEKILLKTDPRKQFTAFNTMKSDQ